MPQVDPARRRHRQAVAPEPTDTFAIAAAALRAAEHVCILTGAGVSAESGVPTFRDAIQGHWARHSPQELATPEAFGRNPQLVWAWYAARRANVRQAAPNPAHLALVSMARFVSHCTLITQNVDDLHQRAGSRDVVALHGSLMRVRCSGDCGTVIEDWQEREDSTVPACPQCGALLRPDVTWFGEPLPSAALTAAQSATLACDIFLSIGTSNMVEPAASLPWLAAQHGATVIVINPTMQGQRTGPSILPLEGAAGTVLPALVSRAFAGRRPRARHVNGAGDAADEEGAGRPAAEVDLWAADTA
jgi:NAD-dependent deacetylase